MPSKYVRSDLVDAPNGVPSLDANGDVPPAALPPAAAAVSDVAGGVVQDAEARTAINAILARLRAYGVIEA